MPLNEGPLNRRDAKSAEKGQSQPLEDLSVPATSTALDDCGRASATAQGLTAPPLCFNHLSMQLTIEIPDQLASPKSSRADYCAGK